MEGSGGNRVRASGKECWTRRVSLGLSEKCEIVAVESRPGAQHALTMKGERRRSWGRRTLMGTIVEVRIQRALGELGGGETRRARTRGVAARGGGGG